MFQLRVFFLLLIFTSLFGYAQNYPDTIFSKAGEIIPCKITLVNDKNIFFVYKKRKPEIDSYISLDAIFKYTGYYKENIKPESEKSPVSVKESEQKQSPADTINADIEKPFLSHFIGGGVQFLAPSTSSEPHYDFSLRYYPPSYFLMYRLMVTNKNRSRDALTINTNYRSGAINTTSGSLSGSGTVAGNFDIIRIDGGFTHFFTFGDYKETSFGVGFYAGGIITANGTFDYSSSGFSYNYLSVKNYKNAYQMLNHGYIGILFELQHQLKISESRYLVIGGRIQIESSEAPGAKIGKVIGAFIGYRFWKKPK